MGGWKWWVVAVWLAGPCGHAAPRNEGQDPGREQDFVRIAHAATADTVRQALRGAEQRLEAEGCRVVFAEFSDASGRPIQETLDRIGHTPGSYLHQILFYDGSRLRRCQAGRVLAVANPGSRVVQVCPEAIRSRYRRDPRYVEAILIHEALHTLGLGENPPSSFEITTRVIARCTR
jgi:hypothetical protein